MAEAVLLRMVKIYLNDRHLLLLKDDNIKATTPPDYLKLIEEIKKDTSSRTIYTSDPEQDLAAIKSLYVVIQAGGGLVATRGGSVLMIHRKGKWDLPKGKLDEGESLESCALREVEEETGLQEITLGDKLCVTYHTYFERGLNILKESHWYHMEVALQQALTPQTEEDIEQCLWVPLEQIEGYYDGAHASIRDVLQAGIPAIRKKLSGGC